MQKAAWMVWDPFSHVEMGIPLMVQVKMGNCFLQEMVEEASSAPRVPA